jgi:hypothetical protein
MSTIARSWNTSLGIIQEQIETFNKSVQSSTKLEDIHKAYEPEALDKIYQVMKQQVQHLQNLSEQIEDRQDKLSHGSLTYRKKTIIKTAFFNGVAKLFVAGGGLTVFIAEELISKGIGFGCLCVGALFDSATTIYSTKAFFNEDEHSTLAQINKDGVEQAKIFKKFIKRLKEIREVEKSRFKEQSVNVNINLDRSISDCLRNYESLGTYSKDEVYYRILSLLIQYLPTEDPLRQDFQTLIPSNFTDISYLASQPLPSSYLALENNKEQASPSSIEKWKGEKDNAPQKEPETQVIDALQAKEEYAKNLACCKNAVAQRFHLRKNISHLYTFNGWCLEDDGIQHSTEINKSTHSHLQEVNKPNKQSKRKNMTTPINTFDSIV